jgi:hypothetical protein
MPRCLPVFSNHYYIALLKRANEAIYLDYILPFRVLHPQATQGGSSDPTMFVPMGSFVGRMKSMVQRHRRDPLDIQVAPIPIGYQTLSGEGKSLLVTEELKMTNELLLNGLGFPADLYYGNLTIQAMPSALRLFENTWSYLVEGYDRLLQWIADKASDYFQWDEIEVALEPVTLADDIEKKQVMLQFAAAQAVSQSTAMGTYGLDYKRELEKKVEDARLAMEVETEAADLRSAEEQMALAAGGIGAPQGTTPMDMISQADQIARNLLSMDDASRRMQLGQLRSANQTMYALVKDTMEKIRTRSRSMAGQEFLASGGAPGIMPQGGGPMPPPPPMGM